MLLKLQKYFFQRHYTIWRLSLGLKKLKKLIYKITKTITMFSDSDTESTTFEYDMDTIDVYGILDLKLHNNDEHLINTIMGFIGYDCDMCDKKEILKKEDEVCKECKDKYTCDVCKEYCGDCIYECDDCDNKCCQDTSCTDGYMNVYVNGSFEMCYDCMEKRLY